MSIYLSQLGVFELQYQLKRVPKWCQVTINTDGINRTPLFVETCCSVTIVILNIVFWVEWPNGAHFFSIVVFNDSYLILSGLSDEYIKYSSEVSCLVES